MTEMDHDLTPEERADAERGRTLVAAAVARERAPLALRESLAARRSTRRRPPLALLAPVGVGLAAFLAAMVLVLSGGSGPPTVSAVSLIALRGPQLGAPATQPGNPDLLTTKADGIVFPEWRKLDWPASGARTDTLEDRTLTTVFYRGRRGSQVGYTIVSGGALDVPDGKRRMVGGVRYTVIEDGGRRIVTWERDGKTCVLSGPDGVPAERMLALAAWKAASPQ